MANTVVANLPLTSVRIRGLLNLDLPVQSGIILDGVNSASPADRYIVENIDGLEPPDVTVAIAKTASGGKYQGRTFADREVVFLIGLNPDYNKGETPQQLRTQLETYLSTGYNPYVTLQFATYGIPYAQARAYVTKFEDTIFSKDPAVQITFQMLNSTFKAISPTEYFASDLDRKHPNIYNWGTAQCGFQFGVTFDQEMPNGWFLKTSENPSIGMVFDYDFQPNDTLTVSTIPGNRFIHVKPHRKKVKNRLGILTNNSEWLELHPGVNRFITPKPYTTGWISGVSIWHWKGRFKFTPEYWGI